jgi:glycosyltransferase involved in cell wall biosynthesis
MKISYITKYDALDIHKLSGTGTYIAKALLNQGVELDYIGNLRTYLNFELIYKKIFYRLTGKNFSLEREPLVVKHYARQVTASLKSNTDIIFSPSSIPIALLESNKPKVIYTDATFAGMIGFFKGFSNFCEETIRNGNILEKQSLESAAMIFYTSDWAAKTAIENYNINPAKIKIVPRGANIICNRNLLSIKEIVSERSTDICNLLFIGIDWERKDGLKAVHIAEKLNALGIKTNLHIIGPEKLPLKTVPRFVYNHGYISKSSIEGQKKIDKILSNAHFLLLPTIADCAPIVFSEANSFGVPCLSTNIGGIAGIIKDDINGKLFSLEASADQYAAYIELFFLDKLKYAGLAYSSFNEYEKRLNWNVSGKSIMKHIREL